jgi:ribosomal protein L11 methyltransferase
MAFGTGTHPTTAMMFALLERWVRPGQRWLDVGTGSGILALGAWLMGADVEAIEPDPVAVRAATANIAAHRAPIEVVHGTLADWMPDVPVDGLMANLTAALIRQEVDHLVSASAPHAVWLLSGILDAYGPSLRPLLAARGRIVREERASGGWLAWVVTPDDSPRA